MTNRPGNCVLVISTCCLILLGGCENRPKTAMGSIIGGSALGTGAFLVSKDSDHTFPITVASTALGALIGAGIGNALDKTDERRKVLTAAIQIALESKRTNEKVEWKSPTKDTGGVVIPRQTLQKSSGEWCRKFDYHIMHNLRVSSGKGLACRNEKTGIWETIGTPSLSTL